MKYKNTESKRTFVPKKIGDTLGKVNRVFSNKYGKIEFLRLSKWPQIVVSFFAEHSEPDKISSLTDRNAIDIHNKYFKWNIIMHSSS